MFTRVPNLIYFERYVINVDHIVYVNKLREFDGHPCVTVYLSGGYILRFKDREWQTIERLIDSIGEEYSEGAK